ncbi:bifunctional UDP-N-acetylmuramoyl-tripeptide:D-alanyl-D-alanine ligase/alanine racemase [Echinicola jeungdonensis]|uniref:Alanine racemase n=1 Tax=Echinicola jeungdonensis TaxID=709343 RepID=A0ABV5J6Q8_9BACT|nr:bifunctional UDP-N-acetylmuramoyl-tripeptide:D-alanyl-D-alanine ligase/alanine racemase [Echinicola jeungdonensis]MDN3669229.1 bifunctional UDP-N-acetylmuramoyl-tripeptide:D-alanyl-D-alanine ligase/alanine racemase [Echinicola jeungdonensis]
MIQFLGINRIASIVQGKISQNPSPQEVQQIVTDSRKIVRGEETLFVALKGFKFDGADFIDGAYQEGVRNFILKEGNISSHIPQANVIQVPDPLAALQALAAWNRKQFTGPVVSITGSNGKTIIKEWLGQILSRKHNLAKSPKSYNSQVGVPLSLFGIEAFHQVAVIEAGISQPGEMEKLQKMIQPDIGIFTNLGTAHDEGFSSREEKLKEKAKLFGNCKFIIYRKDQEMVSQYLESNFPASQLISWSDKPGADYTLSVKKEEGQSKITLFKPDLSIYTFHCRFEDEANLENLRHAIVAALTLGINMDEIQESIPQLKPIEMRLTLKPGINQCLLIDDTYNNDLAGLDIALEFLQNQRPKRRKILMLSDLLEAGESHKVYQRVSQLISHYQIDKIYGVGKDIVLLEKSFPEKSLFFPNTKELLDHLDRENFQDDLILIKGARKFEFEQVVNRLQERIHGTVLEINLNALSHNFNFYKRRLKPSTKLMVMVKAFAYGGGATEITHHLEQLKADYLAVAYTDEGVALRNDGIQLPIMVLNPVPESFHNLLKYKLEPVVYSLSFFKQLGQFCKSFKGKVKIHLDLDTGMHRLGFSQRDLEDLNRLIVEYPELEIASLYTHMAGADEAAHENFSMQQLELFKKMGDKIKSYLGYQPLMHALNSAGIIRYPDYQFDMVRLGIGLYGVEVNGLFEKALDPISCLKTTVSQIKKLKKGETVGYGRKGVMPEDGQIATIAIGYADGYDRRFSNGKGYVLIHGQKAPVIGNVCMDMTMVNATGIDVREGDEVIVYGQDISLKTLAQSIGTIPYELLTNISSRVKRVYYLD